jgi:hypothetical protein
MVVKKFKNGTESHLQKLYNYFSDPIVLEKDNRVSGGYAWAALFAAIIAYDIYSIKTKKTETLTRFFWRQTENKINSLVPLAVWSGLTIHLLLEKSIRRKAFGNTNDI